MKKVLSIGYGRHLFEEGNIERKRMEQYSKELDAFHLIVFTKRGDSLSPLAVDNRLFLHPTNSKSTIGAFFDAVRIAKNILTSSDGWTITAQEPFETALVGMWVRRKCKVPLVIQEHGDFFSTPYWRKERIGNRLRFFVGRTLLKRADKVRVVSERIKCTIMKMGVPEAHIAVLPLRTDVEEVQSTAVTEDARQLSGGASLVILSVGRFVLQKNIPLLLRSFAILTKQHEGAHLLLVGNGPEEEKCMELIQKLGLDDRVTIMPWTDNPISLIKTADIYAHSSNYDGWARVLIEAMAAGTPVVTTDVGCASNVLKHEQHGLVVPVGDEAAFAEALITLAEDKDKRAMFSENAKQDALRIFKNEDGHIKAWVEAHTV